MLPSTSSDSRVSEAVEGSLLQVTHGVSTQQSRAVGDVSKACGVLTGAGSRTIDKLLLCNKKSHGAEPHLLSGRAQ